MYSQFLFLFYMIKIKIENIKHFFLIKKLFNHSYNETISMMDVLFSIIFSNVFKIRI